MNRFFFGSIFLILCFFSTSPLLAQTSSKGVNDASEIDLGVRLTLINPEDEQWTFHLDAQQKIYYIDFESISVNLTDIIIRNSRGDRVYEDEVFDLPVDTIYEIDMSHFPSGQYEIEIKSYTQTIKKSVNLRLH